MNKLSTLDIKNQLKDIPHFVGVFPINKVKDINVPRNTTITFVANLQASNLDGSHWVSVRRSDNNTAFYFDSFGSIPPLEIQNWLMKNSSKWTYNKKRVQKSNDEFSCGYLCIDFVKNT